ncbi:MAG: hypothetical protein FWC32_06615 [Firmicutes bacterium]|nr:hypothetical protein [Bacillota bacterium]
MHFIFKFVSLVVITIFLLTGCTSNRAEEFSPKSVRVLFAGDAGTSPITLFTFVEPDTFEVVSFHNHGLLSNRHSQSPIYSANEISAFDFTLLDDFIAKAPRINYVIGNRNLRNVSNYTIINQGVLELSSEQSDRITNMIGNVAKGRVDNEFRRPSGMFGEFIYVWMIIDDNMYWSLYEPTIDAFDNFDRATRRSVRRRLREYTNSNVLNLAYELVDLSPILVGWEHDPLQTPSSRDQ